MALLPPFEMDAAYLYVSCERTAAVLDIILRIFKKETELKSLDKTALHVRKLPSKSLAFTSCCT